MAEPSTPAAAALEVRLRRLEDREAIREVLTGIARGTDRFDQALLARYIAPDARLDMGGKAPLAGVDFVAALRRPDQPRPGRMHLVSNERIEVSGDTARSETYLVSCQDVVVEGIRKTRVRAGRYLDRFERRASGWQLVERMLIDEWGRVDEVVEMPAQGAHLGLPVPDDPSAEWLTPFGQAQIPPTFGETSSSPDGSGSG